MAISGVGASSGAANSNVINNSASDSSNNVVQNFLAYMKETPAQRMEDQWLAAHGISEQAFKAMSPEQRAKIIAQMRQDIEQQIKDSTNAKTAKQDSAVML